MASVGNSFVVAEVKGEALTRAMPDLARFHQANEAFTALGPRRLPVYLYARVDATNLRARMFSPTAGIYEDPATGSASALLASQLLAHGVLKENWGRARPVQVSQFGGEASFTPPWQPTSECRRNCSFVSGHAGTGFALITLGALAAPRRRRHRFRQPLLRVPLLEEHLAMEIGRLDDIPIDQSEPPHPGPRQHLRRQRARFAQKHC